MIRTDLDGRGARAKSLKMTPAQAEAQRQRFALGNTWKEGGVGHG